jgi:DNA-binding response OmpR family regulator
VSYILVIDDDPEIRELLAIALCDEGYEVGTAASANSALDLIRTRHPDLVLVDLWLRGQSGENFVQGYRALPEASAAVVLLSAAPDLEEAASVTGADRYLSKPFDLDDLLQTLDELLRGR